MADIFSVIADPTRRQLLSLLLERYVATDQVSASGAGDGEYSVSELVAQLELSQPTVSKHLKVLRDTGLVAVREEGQHRFYKIDVSPLEDVEDWLIPFLSADFDTAEEDELWENASDAVKSAAASFGQNVGRRAAATSHAVKSVADDLVSKLRR
ncbi:metalloregulator ArsR/SmtB family transcription factor [Herbiconiux sp.]|jgi:DNA-binding transcriptional ArsR family regulator|uniref:ArsR/SmtB family transcription factor n=1 Tax=Herbiconiux sp. TaxID=1871186 RepID=UPI0025C14F31|nr:metalloregulator ArsR/SmtB family transcription factor [Herbiconiux sp.]